MPARKAASTCVISLINTYWMSVCEWMVLHMMGRYGMKWYVWLMVCLVRY